MSLSKDDTQEKGFKFQPFIPACISLLGITALSVMPSVSLPDFNLLAPDKLGHALVYAIQSWLILRGFARSSKAKPGLREYAIAFGISAAWGVLMEFVQYALLPGRMCEFDDMIANAFGALVAVGSWRIGSQRPAAQKQLP